jgi:hypothetical protein
MPSGVIAWPFLGALLLSAPLAAATVEDRLQLMADQAGTPLRFEESRSSGLFSNPITVRGRLIYDPVTGQLTKQVDTPQPARLSVTETHLVAQVGDGPRRRLPLDRRPDLAALLVTVRAMLAGQVDAVETRFNTTLESDEATGAWVLALQPRDPELAEDLQLIEVLGTDDRVHTLQATLGQEVQRMTILPPEPGPPAENDAR